MIREDIFGGLKLAVSKKESLKQAMITFYNAGYKKEDIEDSAKALLQMQQPVQPQKPVQQSIQKKPVKTIQPKQPIQRVSGYGQKPVQVKINSYKKIKEGINSAIKQLEKIEVPKKQIQKVSTYEQKPEKTKEKLILGVLIFVLIILLGTLTSVFIFKSEVVGFLDGLFV